ncbi:hypothetical protein DM02DRAFT_499064, partial [Periconia macrospinosa]
MGCDAGFDMVPPLSKGVEDREKWAQFIEEVKNIFASDEKVEFKRNYINFNAGEHPKLPFQGHKFLRFSSKITGSNASATGVEHYIEMVTEMTKKYFRPRVYYWNELYDRHGKYSWTEVNASLDSYEAPPEAEEPTELMTSLTGNDTPKNLEALIFEIKEVPGKGKGLIACVDIPAGTRILCEKPIFTAQARSREELEQLIAMKLRTLTKSSQRQFLSLHNKSPGKYPFSGIFKTNALPCGPDSQIGAVYPTVCLINHSCLPNAHNNWNTSKEHETIHATRPIKKG